MAGLRKRNPETMKEIQAFVEDYFFEYHQSPSMQKVADAIGTSKSTAYYYVMEMARNGMLHYDGKTIETPHTQKSDYKMNRVPVLGSIVCGSPELTEEDFEEFVALPVALFGEGDFFVLRTHGHSMVDAGIDEGDMVVVKKTGSCKLRRYCGCACGQRNNAEDLLSGTGEQENQVASGKCEYGGHRCQSV